jgi:hypothetical protein
MLDIIHISTNLVSHTKNRHRVIIFKNALMFSKVRYKDDETVATSIPIMCYDIIPSSC